jgi:peptide/nickel transport system permease protein
VSLRDIKLPKISILVLGLIVIFCILANVLAPGRPGFMNLDSLRQAPSLAYVFGTDQLGRSLFAMILHGGRISLIIGVFASCIAGLIAMLYGTISGLGPKWLDNALMRFTEIIISVPSILYIVCIQGAMGKPNIISLSIVIGLTSWMNIAKLVRAEVRQMHRNDFILAARLMGARLPYLLRRHLVPSFLPSIMFMLIYNISNAIAAEATLSFVGLGMPPDTTTWGSLMSLAQGALLTNSWWIILIPSAFLVATLVCITNIGEYLRWLTQNRAPPLLEALRETSERI